MGTALTIRGAHRRAGDLPARAGGRLVHDRVHAGQGLRLRRVRADAVGESSSPSTSGARVGAPGRSTSGAVIPNRSLELYVDVAACCVGAAMVGLALSALAKSNEQIMPLLVIAIMSQLVFQGGMIPVTGRIGLDQMSWVTPARWGFASTASTIDLIRLVPGPLTPQDSHWKHTAGAWWFNMAMQGRSASAIWASCAGRSGSRAADVRALAVPTLLSAPAEWRSARSRLLAPTRWEARKRCPSTERIDMVSRSATSLFDNPCAASAMISR